MSTQKTELIPAQKRAAPKEAGADGTQSLKSHSLAYIEGDGLRVPVTEIALEPSPSGEQNEPLRVSRTAGPGSDPVVGLAPFRAEWIKARADARTYDGRERNLLDDGKSAVRR